jgi:hypothetical protein
MGKLREICGLEITVKTIMRDGDRECFTYQVNGNKVTPIRWRVTKLRDRAYREANVMATVIGLSFCVGIVYVLLPRRVGKSA